MVIKLQGDVRRKFIWSEISYFSKWWNNIDGQKKDAVKRFAAKKNYIEFYNVVKVNVKC